MANLKELRLRIASVKNTRKITSAMSQIASARLRRAQNAALAARPYGDRMREVVEQLVSGIDPAERAAAHPLLAARDPVERVLVVVMTADRGLCGGFNTNVIRGATAFVERQKKEGREVALRLVGNKAAAVLKPEKGWTVMGKHQAPTLATIVPLSKTVASHVMAAFTSKEPEQRVDRVILYYNHFVSVLTQRATELQLVPLRPSQSAAGTPAKEPTFEPSRTEILAHLVPVAIESMLQQAMFNSVAAEIAARRVAMDAATDNATEMIADLTLEYNRERQAAITKELMEIIGGAEALKG
jgi:F-type H+-transporting ATPase subunit gamma